MIGNDVMLSKKLPLILIAVVICSILLNPIVPLTAKQIIYACSLTIKSIVLFLLPFIIFGLLFKTFVKLSDHATSIICLIFGCLCASNFCNTFITHYIGNLFYSLNFDIGDPIQTGAQLQPYFVLELPKVIKNEFALFGGIASGIMMALIDKSMASNLAQQLDKWIHKLFSIVSILLTFFIIVFVIKCDYEGTLVNLLKSYSVILMIFIAYASVYTFLFYLFTCKWKISECIRDIKNMLPAFVTGVTTISSVLTMPVTIMCAEKNVQNKNLAGSIISATVNIHLLGDCLGIPLLAYAILKHHGLAAPNLESYFIFTIFFVLAKFSVAAIPAGGIIVMTPVLEKYLHFTPDMSSMIIAIYVIFDPFITGFNVIGNGALAKLIDSLYITLQEFQHKYLKQKSTLT